MTNPRVWFTALVVVLIVGFLGGYGLGRLSIGRTAGNTYQDGYEAAKAKLKQSGLLPSNPTEIKSLSGTVKSIGDGSFVMTTSLRSINPLEELNAPAERTVTLVEDAKVYRQAPLSPDDFQKQMEAFQANMRAGKPAEPPTPHSLSVIKLSDLQANDHVIVEADHNILIEAAFAATKVTVSGAALAPVAPAMPPAP